MQQTPYLYSMIDKEKLSDMLEAFESCIKVSIQIIDEHGKVLIRKGDVSPFCNAFMKYLTPEDSCVIQHLNAGKCSVQFGGSYIFSCHANLNHIIYPFLIKGSFFGAVLVGPFLMDKPDSVLISDIARRYTIPVESLLDLYDMTDELPILSPALVTQISKLLAYLFDGLITDSRLEFIANQNKLDQQSRISESIQMYKTSGETQISSYPYEKEKALMTKVKTGNVQEAKGILNDLLGYVLFSAGNDLTNVKSRAIELTSLLSRAAIEGGASTDAILKIDNEFLKNLTDIQDMDDLCLKLAEVVETFTESMFHHVPGKNSDVIKKAFAYISHHYSHNLTLDEVAAEVHLNPAYFSTIFKESSGSSFKEYLNMVRIEESKRLLSNSDYSIIDIAVATGFEDQSYFSKVFKKYTGLTPKQYR